MTKKSFLYILVVLAGNLLFSACENPVSDSGKAVTPQTPVIETQPQSAEYAPGETVEALTVAASVTDGGTLSYQWYSADSAGAAGAAIADAVGQSYTPPIPDTITADTVTWYWAVAANARGGKTATAASSRAAISVTNTKTPVIGTQPQSAEYEPGETAAELTVEATVNDGGTLSYQWYKADSADDTTGTVISDEITASYTPSIPASITADVVTWYWVVVTNTKDGQTALIKSAVARVTVTNTPSPPAAVPVIGTQPQNAEYAPGAAASALTVAATVTDDGTLSYKWFKADSADGEGAAITGANGASYTPVLPASVTADTVIWYWVVVTNTTPAFKTASTASDKATITVIYTPQAETPTIGTQPQGATYSLYVDTASALTVAASVTDGGTLSYQWYSAASANADGTVIDSATTASYTPPLDAAGTVYYYVSVTNTVVIDGETKTATVKSGAAAIVVNSVTLPLIYRVNEAGDAFTGTFASSQTVTATLTGDNAAIAGAKNLKGETSATLKTVDTGTAVSGNTNGYIALGSITGKLLKTLESWTLETYVYIPAAYTTQDLGDAPYVFTFAKKAVVSGSSGNGPVMSSPLKNLWFRMSPESWGSWGSTIMYTQQVDGDFKAGGAWRHIVYTLDGPNKTARVYMDGVKKMERIASGNDPWYNTTDLDVFEYGFLGHAPNNTDANLKAQYYQFSLYSGAQTPDVIAPAMAATLYQLNGDPPVTDFTFAASTDLKVGTSTVAAGATVGSFGTVVGGTAPFAYSLVAGSGDTNNGLFTISGADLKVGSVAISDAGTKYVRVQITDSKNETFVKACTLGVAAANADSTLKLHHTFAAADGVNVLDATGNHTGKLMNGATLGTENGIGVLVLGGDENDWFDVGSTLGPVLSETSAITVSVYMYVATAPTKNALWAFGTDEYSGGDYPVIHLQLNDGTTKKTEVDASMTGWSNHKWVYSGSEVAIGAWVHLLYTQDGNTGKLYYNGAEVASASDVYTLNQLSTSARGALDNNSIGKHPHGSWEKCLKDTKVADFRVYNRVLSGTEITALYASEIFAALSSE